jgi:hypothetical protein
VWNAYIFLRAFLKLKFQKCDCVAYRFACHGPGNGLLVRLRQDAVCVQKRFEYCGVTKLKFDNLSVRVYVYYSVSVYGRFEGCFANLRKATISFVMSIYTSP